MSLGLVAILTWMAVAAAVGPTTTPVPVRIDFAAPAGCADEDAFWSGITSRTDRARAARAGEAAMRMTVRLTRSAAKVQGELRIAMPGRHVEARRVEGATCTEVVQVLSLTAALAVDPSATIAPMASLNGGRPSIGGSDNGRPAAGGTPPAADTTPPPGPQPPPGPPPPPPPLPPPPVESRPPETARVERPDRPVPILVRPEPPAEPPTPAPPRGPALSAAVVAARLMTSSLSLGGELSARLASRAVRRAPSLTVSFLFLAGDFFHDSADLGIRWLAGSVDGCPGWVLGGFASVEPCVRFTAGVLTVTDHDVNTPRPVSRWWGSGGLALHGQVGAGAGWWLRAELGVDFPIVERGFTVGMTNPQQVGATASISPTLAVGLAHGL